MFYVVRKWWQKNRRFRTDRRAPGRKVWLSLEPLEDRLAPANVTWIAGSANWNTPAVTLRFCVHRTGARRQISS